MKITEEPIPELSQELWRYAQKPYGGFFGNAVIVQVIQEIVANPSEEIRPTDLADSLEKSYNMVNSALNTLTVLKFLQKDLGDPQRPIYRVDLNSKRLLALTFFASAVVDDRDGTDTMIDEVLDYCSTEKLHCYAIPIVETQFVSIENLVSDMKRDHFTMPELPKVS